MYEGVWTVPGPGKLNTPASSAILIHNLASTWIEATDRISSLGIGFNLETAIIRQILPRGKSLFTR